jgi:hypothetical protein
MMAWIKTAIKYLTYSTATRAVLLSSAIGFIPLGCATNQPSTNQSGSNHTGTQACLVKDAQINRNGTPGLELVNECDQCVAVAFEYRDLKKETQWSACYVPPQTRVVFWEAGQYWLIAQKPCVDVKKHGLGGISAAILEHNDRIGRCDTRRLMATNQ